MLWLRRIFTAVAVFFLSIMVFYAIARTYVVYTDSLIEGNRSPYMQKPAADAISVLWHTEAPEIGVVRYGTEPGQLDNEIREQVAGEAHELRLTGLQPDQRYYYAVGNTDAMIYKGEDRWFNTAPETGAETPVRIWVIGDAGYASEVSWAVRDAMLEWSETHPRQGRPYIDQWLTLGDNAYRSGSNQQFRFGFFNPYAEILKSVAPWPGYGNHDARRNAFFRIFSLPEQAEAGGVASGSEHYYSFDYANVHTIMLDSEDSDHSPEGKMLSWLKRDLEAYRAASESGKLDWLIVAFHRPPYSKGSHNSDREDEMVEMRENVVPLLERYGVDLVLSGHSHVYERSQLIDCHYGDSSQFGSQHIVSNGIEGQSAKFIKPEKQPHAGTVYVVAGASAKVDRAELDHPVMAVGMMQAGSLLIDIEGNRLVARYLSDKAEVADQFSIEKRADDSWQQYRNPQYAGCQQ